MDPKTRQELQELLSALLDGVLEPGQQDRLGELLQQHFEARDLYLAYFELHAELALTENQRGAPMETAPSSPDGAEVERLEAQTPVRGERHPSFRFLRVNRLVLSGAIGLAGLAAGLLLSLWLPLRTPSSVATPATEGTEPTDENVAVLVQAPGVEWGETNLPTQPGAPLPPGWLRLKSGVVQIQFYSGATVILEGPADLQLISPREAYCSRGKLRATVPPQAQGFTIGSPKLELVDLGTEFGLRVDEDDKTEVHVFQGKVKLYDAGSGRADSSRKELTTGRGLCRDESGTDSPIASDPSAFRTAQQLGNLAEEEARRRYRAWLAVREHLRQDPRLLLYYTFQTDRPWDRTLSDQVKGRQEPWDGTIVGCEWARGRWPEKQALEFKRPGDRVRINVPGEYESITLMAWVRLDSLENKYNGLLVTDKWGDGRLHWQIRQDQTLYMSMLRFPGEHNEFASPPIVGPAYLGHWTHLAAVYNCREETATHYLNGRTVSSHEILYPHAIQFGAAAIGNWGAPAPGHPNPIRNLNGRMDEFLLFNQVLEAQEIHDLYQAGKPHS